MLGVERVGEGVFLRAKRVIFCVVGVLGLSILSGVLRG